ncbi:MAG: GNAT family N-acetyltransferase [Pirellulales bacterium]
MSAMILESSDPRWSGVLAGLAHDVYHLGEYASIEAQRLNAKAAAFVFTQNEKTFFLPYLVRECETVPNVPKVWDVVSPYGYPGALTNDAGKNVEFVARALTALRETWSQSGICSAFLRMHPIFGARQSSFFPSSVLGDSGQTVAIDLQNPIDEQMSKGHRRTIDKCRKLGYVVRFVPLTEAFERFTAIYKQTMDRVNANNEYYFDDRYFTSLAELEQVTCAIAELGDEVAATCLFFNSHGVMQAHLGGTADAHFQHSPFHYVLNQAAHWGKSHGAQWLHLGGGVGGAR